jgi:hypothetical protein
LTEGEGWHRLRWLGAPEIQNWTIRPLDGSDSWEGRENNGKAETHIAEKNRE